MARKHLWKQKTHSAVGYPLVAAVPKDRELMGSFGVGLTRSGKARGSVIIRNENTDIHFVEVSSCSFAHPSLISWTAAAHPFFNHRIRFRLSLQTLFNRRTAGHLRPQQIRALLFVRVGKSIGFLGWIE